MSFNCTKCDRSYSYFSGLCKHRAKCHPELMSKCRDFECHDCGAKFVTKSSLEKHVLAVHLNMAKSTSMTKRNNLKQCPICDEGCLRNKGLDQHLQSSHSISLEVEYLEFATKLEFESWKDGIERESTSRFLKTSNDDNHTYFSCHRSRSVRKVNKKTLTWRPSIKVHGSCPARIVLKEVSENKFRVKFIKTHIGHDCSVQYLRLTKQERAFIASQISAGVSFDQILNNIRDSVTNKFERIHLIERKDLHNISSQFRLDQTKRALDDRVSSEMWFQEQLNLGSNSPVIYLKRQGEPDESGMLDPNDFIIVIMTKYQQDIISELASEKVLIDSTHGTSGYDFQLTTIVSIDEFGAGCAVSMCLSNRIDFPAMSVFFAAVKEKVGILKTKVFMSDDFSAYYNAWCHVMCTPDHHLLCTWHVDRSWKRNLLKLKNSNIRAEVYKGCRVLLETPDSEKFGNLLSSFLNYCFDSEETKDFGMYFANTYSHRPEQWAYCYRKGLGLNTNMYLEALHKKLKYCYLDGKQNRRLDKCLFLILKFSRDLAFDRLIRVAKNKPTHRMQSIGKSHASSLLIDPSSVQYSCNNTWLVKSSSKKEQYTVIVQDDSKCNGNCPLSCPECQICIHRAECTCVDHTIRANLCKHIHSITKTNEWKSIYLPIKPMATLQNDFVDANFQYVSDNLTKTSANEWQTGIESYLSSSLGLLNEVPKELLPEMFRKAEHLFQWVKSACKKQDTYIPANKLIVQQARLFSTKKPRKIAASTMITRPTDAQKREIEESLMSEKETIYIHSGFDHNYSCGPRKKI